MRTATIRTDHGDDATAERIASALRPDNTDEIATRVEASEIVTEIDRETTGGLHSTVDDYVVNLPVAVQLSDRPTTHTS